MAGASVRDGTDASLSLYIDLYVGVRDSAGSMLTLRHVVQSRHPGLNYCIYRNVSMIVFYVMPDSVILIQLPFSLDCTAVSVEPCTYLATRPRT